MRFLMLVLAAFALVARSVAGQSVAIRDLVLADAAPPVRLVGYGLVTGLSGTGDHATGLYGSRHTVQSVVNLLRRFDIEVPEQYLRTRNVAAVLVTAEVSPFLRPGGRFDVRVSSLGDAQSLRGGTLWMTPLVTGPGADAVAAAQGALLLDASPDGARSSWRGVTSARVTSGGMLDVDLPRPRNAAGGSRLLLREPDIGTATRIAAVIDSALGGRGNATVEDAGSVAFTPRDTAGGSAAVLARVRELRVGISQDARIVIDARDGTISTGGDLRIADGIVSHGGITLIIGATSDTSRATSVARVASGTSARDVAEALRALRVSAAQTAAIFAALRDAHLLTAEVVVR